MKRMKDAGAEAWLVNTGWNGSGKRISLADTRAIINAILSGDIAHAETTTLPVFNLEIPLTLQGVDSKLLDPRQTWASEAEWETKARDLAQRFINNFDKFTDTKAGEALVKAGPKL